MSGTYRVIEPLHILCIIMAALWNRTGNYILALWFFLLLLLLLRLLLRLLRLLPSSIVYIRSSFYLSTLSGYIFAPKACIDNRKKTS